jgi:hypothetical protein
MNIAEIIESLKLERNRINAAIAALDHSGFSRKYGARKKRTMSAAARAKIAAAQRARWAKQKAAQKKAAK